MADPERGALRIVHLHGDDYARLTGGHVYNSRLFAALSAQCETMTELSVRVAFPTISAIERERLAAAFALMQADTVLLSDHLHVADLASELMSRRFRVASVFHHSKTIEDRANGHSADREAERLGFSACDAVIVTSDATRDYVQSHYAVAPERIVVAIPGHDPALRSTGPAAGSRNLLTLGAIIPRKRQDYLVEVVAALQGRGWRWRIVGDPDRDRDYVSALSRQIAGADLGGYVELAGSASAAELERIWDDTALLVAASHYEGYGMAVAEALRRGVPVVTTESGAVGTWARGGVVIAPSDDARAFGGLIDGLLANPVELAQLAEDAWAFGSSLPAWEDTFAGIGVRLAAAIACASVSVAA